MQVTQADAKGCKRVGVEEHLITFKSSPNLKNMKKFIMSRSETSTSGSPIPAALGAPGPPTSNFANFDNHHMYHPGWQKTEVQPPLPLDPPPPDYNPNLQVKQEIIDTEYENHQPSPRPENHQEEGHTEQTNQTNEQSSEICRDFVRGTCKREGTCRYAHKHDLSQLEGVYTFCRKFQNSVCTFTNCKYVHATVFEEQHFYRTGILPAHALTHKLNNNNNNNVLQPPPPPPPPEEPPVVPFNIDFSNPPPPLRNDVEKPTISCVPTSSMEARSYMGEMNNQIPMQNSSPLKREWSNMETFAAPPCDLAYNEPLSKKCKHCDILEFRLDHNKNKVKKMLQSKEQLTKKMVLLDKQSEKLRSLISEFLRPTISPKAQTHNNGINGDKDKTLWEQLNTFLSSNSRLSNSGEDK